MSLQSSKLRRDCSSVRYIFNTNDQHCIIRPVELTLSDRSISLFVAPVESDLPSKAAEKSRATSPARSSIRHHARPDSRGRRSLARRHAALNDRMNALRQTLGRDLPSLPSNSSVDRDVPALPWLARQSTQDNDSPNGQNSSRPRPFREVLREMARSDEQRRDRTGLDSIFGITWQDEDDANRADNDRSEMDLGWWGHESRLARNRNVSILRALTIWLLTFKDHDPAEPKRICFTVKSESNFRISSGGSA